MIMVDGRSMTSDAPQVSRAAVWGAVLSLVSLLGPCIVLALPGLVLGRLSGRKIRQEPQRYRGIKWANWAVGLGITGCLLTVPMWWAVYELGVLPLRYVEAMATDEARTGPQLQRVAGACVAYAQTHDGIYPDHLGRLVAGGAITYADLDTLVGARVPPTVPVNTDAPDASEQVAAHSDFAYFGAGLRVQNLADVGLLLAERYDRKSGQRWVAYADGRVELVRSPECLKLAGLTDRIRQQRGLPPLEMP